MENLKKCSKCGEVKPLSQFHNRKGDYKRSECSACRAEYHRHWYLKNKAHRQIKNSIARLTLGLNQLRDKAKENGLNMEVILNDNYEIKLEETNE